MIARVMNGHDAVADVERRDAAEHRRNDATKHRIAAAEDRTDDEHRADDAAELLDALSATDIRLYDASDLPWITLVIEQVMACLGQPYRVLRERLEHVPIRADRVASILGAMRRLMDGRAQRTKVARKVRASVLGAPALTDDARAERLATASEQLGIDPSEIESLLWIDLADERPVTLPHGRPDEQRLVSFANVDRIQRALRRARHVRVHAWGNALPLIRAAARFGLLVRVSAAPSADVTSSASSRAERSRLAGALEPRDALPHVAVAVSRETDKTVLDIIGPLSLFHHTQVYGRALGSIVPYLPGLDRFIVEIDGDFGYGMAALRVASPAMLPPPPSEERGTPSIGSRIASALDRTGDVLVERDPPPICHGTDRLFPDLAFEIDRRASMRPLGVTLDVERSALGGDDGDGEREEDHELFPDLVSLLATQMNDESDRLALRPPRPRVPSSPASGREIVAALSPQRGVNRATCWFIEVVGFATREYLAAKLARYENAGIERVVLVVDDTRDAELATMRRVIAYKPRSIVADLLAITEEAA